jgi:hypothetical protein
MALYPRLMGLTSPKLPVHQFCAALAERERNRMTIGQIRDFWGMDQSERQAADELFDRISNGLLRPREVEEVLELGEQRVPPYDSVALVMARLGVSLGA